MPPASATFLALACFMMAAQTQISGELDRNPKISVIPGQDLILGENATFFCHGPHGGLTFILTKDGNATQEQHQPGPRAEFHIVGAEEEDEGEYACLYKSRSSSSPSSEPSEPLEVTVREHYLEPFIMVSPQRMVNRGTDLVIHCLGRRPNMRFWLFKNKVISQQKDPSGNVAEFHVAGATEKDVGQYICHYCAKPDIPEVCSDASEPVLINVTGLKKPGISWEKDPDLEGGYIIHCWPPEVHGGSWFSLYSGEDLVGEEKAEGDATQVTFSVNQSAGDYRCMYRVRVAGDLVNSPLSDLVADGRDFTRGNNARFLLATLVLILMALVIAEDHYSHKKEERQTAAKPLLKSRAQAEDIQQNLYIHDSA